MSFKPDAETLKRLREFSKQQLHEYRAKQREIKALESHLGGDLNQSIDHLVGLMSQLSAQDLKRAVDKLSIGISLIPNNTLAPVNIVLSPYMELLLGVSHTAAKEESAIKSSMVAVGS